ncbi:ammonium transporter Rh type B-A-like, partial [Diadema antillarum]|uniref:ammonium transporter Rh type B-A-like n=1 Tax=Diadema antillarum TaxID=105358 RepID=UPI003A8481A2
MGFFRGKLTAVLLIFEILFVILFAVFVRYDPHVAAPGAKDDEDFYSVDKYYGLFQDVHVMMFIGFGFLMTFLKRYGYGSVGFNFLLAAFVIQWSTLYRGFLELEHGEIYVNIQTMLFADFTSAAILISFGALLGKASPLQLIIMAFFEVICAIGNEHIGVNILGTVDIGGSMYVHTFGAYFGIAASCVVSSKAAKDHPKEGASYTSDLFSMIAGEKTSSVLRKAVCFPLFAEMVQATSLTSGNVVGRGSRHPRGRRMGGAINDSRRMGYQGWALHNGAMSSTIWQLSW